MEPKLKPIPLSLTKEKLVKIYFPMPEKTIIENINEIIYNNRKDLNCNKEKKRTQIIRTRYVWRKELIELFEIIGVPDGYETPKP